MAAAAFRRSWAAACSTVRSLQVGDPDAMAEGLRCQEGWSSPWLACAVRCLPCQQPHSRSERSLRPLACHAVSAPPPPQVRGGAPSPSASSCDRECPLGTAGDRCLWHVGGTRPVGTMWLAPVGEGSPLAGRCGSPRVERVSLASCEAARQPVAGRITVSRAACSAALGGLPQRRPLVPITGSGGETSPPSARLSSAVQQALIGILRLRAKTHQISTCNPPLYHFVHELSIR